MSADAAAAWWNRGASLAAVAAWLALARVWAPGAEERANLHYTVVTTLGYGHLLGAWLLARGHRSASRRAWLGGAWLALGLANLLAGYAWLLERWPPALLLFLGVSVWHSVENDLALGGAYGHGHRLGPLPRGLDAALVCAGGTALVLASARAALSPPELGPLAAEPLAAAGHWPFAALGSLAGLALAARAPRDRRGALGLALAAGGAALLRFGGGLRSVGFADVFAAITLHHLVSWLLLLLGRARATARVAPGEGRRLALRVACYHLAPAALAAALAAAPGPAPAAVRGLVFAPALYLFASLLHVAQTALARGLAARERTAPAT